MKKTKIAAMLLVTFTALSLGACGGQSSGQGNSSEATASGDSGQEQSTASDSGNGGTQDNTEASAEGTTGGGNVLIAYFSVPETDGVDTVSGASRVAVDGEVLGNNEYIARMIQENVGGDLFPIETVQEYPGTHDALLEFAYNEMQEDARPELATQIENFDSYDTVFLGYPNWNADLPMPLYTFLESYDFSGKTIIPFCTSASDPIDNSLHIFQELAPDAVIEEGFTKSVIKIPASTWCSGL